MFAALALSGLIQGFINVSAVPQMTLPPCNGGMSISQLAIPVDPKSRITSVSRIVDNLKDGNQVRLGWLYSTKSAGRYWSPAHDVRKVGVGGDVTIPYNTDETYQYSYLNGDLAVDGKAGLTAERRSLDPGLAGTEEVEVCR